MSKYEWERGTIVIPSGQWSAFRKSLIEKWNAGQTNDFNLAKRAYDEATKAAKGLRGTKRSQAIMNTVANICGGRIQVAQWGTSEEYTYRGYAEHSFFTVVERIIEGYTRYDQNGVPVLKAPKKSDLKVFAVTKDCTIMMDEACITFNNANKSVTWDVPENNRAGEAAREHWFAKEFFTALDKIEWKRGSGGEIVGNDEYNRGERGSSRGGNYVIAEYSLAATKRKQEAAKAFRSSYDGWYGGGYRRY